MHDHDHEQELNRLVEDAVANFEKTLWKIVDTVEDSIAEQYEQDLEEMDDA